MTGSEPINPNRLTCLACNVSFSRHREPHATLYAPLDSSFLLIDNVDPGRVYFIGNESRLAIPSYKIGVTHHVCIDRTVELFTLGRLKSSKTSLAFDQSRYTSHHDFDVRPQAGACAFCGSAEDLNDEHVWPRWISKLLRERFGPQTFDPRRSTGAVSRESIKVVTPICMACNGGWLNTLETDVKPFLSKMVTPAEMFRELSTREQELLAVWAYKTALMMDLAREDGPQVRMYHYALLRVRRTVPDNVKVWTGAYHGKWAARSLIANVKIGQRIKEPNAFAFTFTAFKVLFQVLIVNPWGRLAITNNGQAEPDLLAEAGFFEIPSNQPVTWPRNGLAFKDDAMDTVATRFGGFKTNMYLPDGREFEE